MVITLRNLKVQGHGSNWTDREHRFEVPDDEVDFIIHKLLRRYENEEGVNVGGYESFLIEGEGY